MTPKYQRILLKLSGEALMGDDAFGINRPTIQRIAAEIKEVSDLGVAIGIVIGGGNIFRGVSTSTPLASKDFGLDAAICIDTSLASVASPPVISTSTPTLAPPWM